MEEIAEMPSLQHNDLSVSDQLNDMKNVIENQTVQEIAPFERTIETEISSKQIVDNENSKDDTSMEKSIYKEIEDGYTDKNFIDKSSDIGTSQKETVSGEPHINEGASAEDKCSESLKNKETMDENLIAEESESAILQKQTVNIEPSVIQEIQCMLDQVSESLQIIQKYNSDSLDDSSSESEDSESDSEDSEKDGEDVRMIDVSNENKKKPEEESAEEQNSESSDGSSSESEDSESDSEDSEEDGQDVRMIDVSNKNKKKPEERSEGSEEDEDVTMIDVRNKKKKKPEEESWLSVLGIDSVSTELPDISSLNLNDREEFVHMGNLESIIDKIVTVAGLPQLPAYDLDTLLFLEEGRKVLGYVFDVMGPVTAPVYILQMSSVEAIKDLELQKDTKVFCAPRSQYTKYVLIEELLKIRGSDASWVGDLEVPAQFQEYSDDEQERQSKAPKKENKRKRSQERNAQPATMDRLPTEGGQSQRHTNRTPTRDRNQNSQNQQQGRVGQTSFSNNPQRVVNILPNSQNCSVVNPVAVAARNAAAVAMFNPSVPPPNLRMPTFYPVPAPMMHPPPMNSFVPPRNFGPRGANFNRGNNGPFFRQNMPGPSDGNWFNQ